MSYRREQLHVEFDADKAMVDRLGADMDVFTGAVNGLGGVNMVEGDTLKLSYTCNVDYFGNTLRALRTITRICEQDAEKIKHADLLTGDGECVFAEMVMALQECQAALRRRKQ